MAINIMQTVFIRYQITISDCSTRIFYNFGLAFEEEFHSAGTE